MTGTTQNDPSTPTETFELTGCPLVDARNAGPSGSTRRNVLRAAGIVALGAGGVGALAACASDDAGTTPSTGAGSSSAPASSAPASSAPASSAPASSSSPSASSKPSASESSSAAVPDGTKVAKSDVPEGGGIVLEDADYVVTQPSKGVYKAFTKRCTHQGNPLGSIEGNNILCPFHGSKFSITDGSVTAPPATKALQEYKVVEAGSDIVVIA